MNVTILGIDLAKDVYQLHGINAQKKAVLLRQVKRCELPELINKLPPLQNYNGGLRDSELLAKEI